VVVVVALVADQTRTLPRVAIAGAACAVAIAGALGTYVLVNLDEAKSIATTSDANRLCRRALEANADMTCLGLLDVLRYDPWGREFHCTMVHPKHAQISSLGRDGAPKGNGADGDVICEPEPLGDEEYCACRDGAD